HRSVQKIPIPLEKIFKHVIGNLKGRIDECGGKVEIPEKMPVVMAGKTLLIQILTNLIENAVTYREPDIPLKITVKCEENNGWVIIGIADNGIGIAPEFQKKIFNVFQRLHSESEYPGTGIGLAIVKKSIEIMGGEVWVESSLGKGSAFYIKLRSAKKY
ncbi:MAG: GHKL domain-containing protein, partial [Candidatus Aminicenantes bacterium]|nr:GHKL domain-containing protein [Candidatus Aminicenantes bacterium]